MCGRFSQSERVDRIAEIFGADPEPGLGDGSYNVAPTDRLAMVVDSEDERQLLGADWGFRPFWRGSDRRRAPGWINARAETAAESSAFGPALRRTRCVIPVDAFYEWDRAPRPPQPYAIGPSGAGGMLALAGIWTSAEHGEHRSAAILTTTPNRAMERLHNRMPVVLSAADLDAWLAPDAPLEEILPLLAPAPDDAIRIWPVSSAVNRVGTDGPELLVPIDGVSATLGLV
ncbi:MAG TPA: SOS response-associated peptidase [Candidatus Limnocylindria bacterium]|jgi:putative SOS response-associated peptidase YedK